MPRLQANDDMQQHTLGNHFGFSAVRVERLEATSYTLVTLMIDATGSVSGFADQLLKMLVTVIKACQKSPSSDNLLVRVCVFNSAVRVQELHGFKLLADVDPSSYPEIDPRGMTPLCDASYSAIASSVAYAKQLRDSHYECNAILVVVTDGGENASSTSMSAVQEAMRQATSREELESLISILIGVDDPKTPDPSIVAALDKFHKEAGFSHYIGAVDATPGKIAKLAQFVSQSISSQQQSQGTGGPSQNINATI